MPITPTYPGVYVEEIPSGVHTITGVATSITAFIGRALRGPVNAVTALTSFADFQRTYGGIDPAYPMSYAVQQFYLNGGTQALIVRLFTIASGDGIAKATIGGLALEAASPGQWGSGLTVTIDQTGITDAIAQQYGAGLHAADLFNLTVADAITKVTENIRNVTVKNSSRRVDNVLPVESQLLRTQASPLPASVSAGTGTLSTGAADSDALTTTAEFVGDQASKTGMYALENADLFNLLNIPPDTFSTDVPHEVLGDALAYCKARRAMLIVDPPSYWGSVANVTDATNGIDGSDATKNLSALRDENACVYFPEVMMPDPMAQGRLAQFPPGGTVAGVFARTDAQRGVWKAPAGIEATLAGVPGLSLRLTDGENGKLNPIGVNCLRAFPVYGQVVWGARTLKGADQIASEWKYLPVRRTALFIEESLYRGTKWVVFEPNDEPLWAQIRLNIGAFMHNLFRQGAFQGTTPRDAYFVKCDSETTTQNDINLGIVNIVVGFAPLKPAEFVMLQIQQMAGQIQV